MPRPDVARLSVRPQLHILPFHRQQLDHCHNAFGTAATGNYGGFLCDAIRLRSCRGNSDFDVTHLVSADGIFELPFGRGRWLGRNMSAWLNQIVGGWQVAGLFSSHTGFAFTTISEAFPVSFNSQSPAVFKGSFLTLG
jgi:hypothetical protein